jgi:hypothetical protein
LILQKTDTLGKNNFKKPVIPTVKIGKFSLKDIEGEIVSPLSKRRLKPEDALDQKIKFTNRLNQNLLTYGNTLFPLKSSKDAQIGLDHQENN